jgi:hypothetical protein
MNKSSAFSMYAATTAQKDKDSRSVIIESILEREKAMLKTPKPKSKDHKRKLSKNLANNISKQNGIEKKVKVGNVTIADVTFNKIQSQPQSTPKRKSKDHKRKLSKNLVDNIGKQNGIEKVTIADVTFNKIQSHPQSTPIVEISKNKAGTQDSVVEGKREFQKLIDPVKIEDFIK